MKDRVATVERKTGETQIRLEVRLDGRGRSRLRTGIGFLEHMLELLAFQGNLDLEVEAEGDLQVDEHHLTEDIGIVLGQGLAQALGQRRGIKRYGFVLLPMDEVLVAVALDLGGRFAFSTNYAPARDRVGDLSTELISHFFQSLASHAGAVLHLQFLNPGHNEHHRVEALFKGFGRALRMAAKYDPERIKELPSSKGKTTE